MRIMFSDQIPSDQVYSLVGPLMDRDFYEDDAVSLMKKLHLNDGAYIQYRDDDGDVFRLVVKNGDIKKISPKWDI